VSEAPSQDAGARGGRPAVTLRRAADATVVAVLTGPWHLQRDMPSAAVLEAELRTAGARRLAFDAAAMTRWDSSLLTFVLDVGELCARQKVTVDTGGLPSGAQRLLNLATAVPERQGARQRAIVPSWLARVGAAAVAAREPIGEFLAFLGDVTIALGRLARRKARFRVVDLALLIQQAGAQALGIVTLISFLVGVILAFVGAVQLEQFGAAIYVANLVGIAMVREMGAMMTAIVMAGRTGAAYAAQLGTMKVTQEVDALSTMGISPLDFLVLPRMIALCVMMPLLCIYADVVGIVGGATIGVGMLKLPLRVYYDQTISAIHFGDLAGGIFKASVYGVLIAIAGCLRGMQCGNSSSAVGDAATSAVVTGIVLIISACGLFSVVFYVLGI
jgi:phospholipid/cholesterol/gamma-HCH transport system permease protein